MAKNGEPKKLKKKTDTAMMSFCIGLLHKIMTNSLTRLIFNSVSNNSHIKPNTGKRLTVDKITSNPQNRYTASE